MHPEYPNLYQRARKATRLSQEEAAERLGLSAESLKQYEGGRRVPPDDVVARMVEVYDLPWLALEHSQATDRLGVLPEVEQRPLPQASIALARRVRQMTGQLNEMLDIAEDGRIDENERPVYEGIIAELRDLQAAIYQYIYADDGAKNDRPDVGASKRSRSQGGGPENDCKKIISQSRQIARGSFAKGACAR